MKSKYIIIVYLLFLGSCSSSKHITPANRDNAILKAISDFIRTYKTNKTDRTFAIYVENINEDILGISIREDPNSILVVTDDSIEYNYRGFPSMYFEQNGKLFYWDDSTKNVSADIIDILTKYNHIDTMIMNAYIPERIIDHSKKGVHYYFCKNNLLKYKKVRTKKAMGWYEPPKLNCK